MEEGSKRRLIGTTVVVVLLVIFVPMLLEEEATPPAPMPDTAMKAHPHPEMDAEFRPAAKPPALATITELPPPDLLTSAERSGMGPGGSVAPVEPAVAPPSAAPKPTPSPKPTTPKTAEAQKLAEAQKPAEASQEAAKPAEPAPKKSGAGWVFQVASLNERPKADAMAADLKAKGFPAFVETAEVNGKTYHRVRVGPRQERKQIDALAASVRDKTGLTGQIQRY